MSKHLTSYSTMALSLNIIANSFLLKTLRTSVCQPLSATIWLALVGWHFSFRVATLLPPLQQLNTNKWSCPLIPSVTWIDKNWNLNFTLKICLLAPSSRVANPPKIKIFSKIMPGLIFCSILVEFSNNILFCKKTCVCNQFVTCHKVPLK